MISRVGVGLPPIAPGSHPSRRSAALGRIAPRRLRMAGLPALGHMRWADSGRVPPGSRRLLKIFGANEIGNQTKITGLVCATCSV
jgi:hypothetical protein